MENKSKHFSLDKLIQSLPVSVCFLLFCEWILRWFMTEESKSTNTIYWIFYHTRDYTVSGSLQCLNHLDSLSDFESCDSTHKYNERHSGKMIELSAKIVFVLDDWFIRLVVSVETVSTIHSVLLSLSGSGNLYQTLCMLHSYKTDVE